MAAFAGLERGLWCLNGAARLDDFQANYLNLYDPVLAAGPGAKLALEGANRAKTGLAQFRRNETAQQDFAGVANETGPSSSDRLLSRVKRGK